MGGILSHLSLEDKDAILGRLLVDLVGGAETSELLCAYHDATEQRNLAALGERYGLSKQATMNRIRRAHTNLRRVGLMPEGWETCPNRPKSASPSA